MINKFELKLMFIQELTNVVADINSYCINLN